MTTITNDSRQRYTSEEYEHIIEDWFGNPDTQESMRQILTAIDEEPHEWGATNTEITAALGWPSKRVARFTYSMRRAGLLWTRADNKNPRTLRMSATLMARHTIEGELTWRP